MEKSSQIAWKITPLRHFFPLKVVPLIEVLLYLESRMGLQVFNLIVHALDPRVKMYNSNQNCSMF
jgi:hypothetical protein